MPIKVFAAPGGYRDDFSSVEQQVNEWLASEQPDGVSLHCMVNEMHERPDLAPFMLTIVVQYERTEG